MTNLSPAHVALLRSVDLGEVWHIDIAPVPYLLHIHEKHGTYKYGRAELSRSPWRKVSRPTVAAVVGAGLVDVRGQSFRDTPIAPGVPDGPTWLVNLTGAGRAALAPPPPDPPRGDPDAPRCAGGCGWPGELRFGGKKYCPAHYTRMQRHGHPGSTVVKRRKKTGKPFVPQTSRTCEHPGGCLRPHHGKGWCGAHYSRVELTGDPGPVEIQPRSQWVIPPTQDADCTRTEHDGTVGVNSRTERPGNEETES